ncbi:MAG: diadenylate cyclase CdaA [Oscillospiraceae bacterium]|nr:diadenylate cyclase CdaA [Oscillospiraceae bacterium]
MQYIYDFYESALKIIQTIRISDVIDVIIISFLIYMATRFIIETRAVQIVKGIFVLILSYLGAVLFDLRALELLLSGVFNWGVIAIIVLFQPELRRALEKMGRANVVDSLSIFTPQESAEVRHRYLCAIDNIVKAADLLSHDMTGALIVIERDIKLGEEIHTGIKVNADVNAELICNIFVNKSPLHDGALVIRDARILAAACYLPRPSKEEYIAHELGSRHRAAIGISENSDSITIVVSEETGIISVAENGVLSRNFNKNTLYDYLRANLLLPENTDADKKTESSRKKKIKEKGKN